MEDEFLSNAARQAGISQADLEELQKNDGNEAKAREIAEESIKSQFNLSMDEIENLSEMSEAEQEQWAKNYAEQQMQTAQQVDCII